MFYVWVTRWERERKWESEEQVYAQDREKGAWERPS